MDFNGFGAVSVKLSMVEVDLSCPCHGSKLSVVIVDLSCPSTVKTRRELTTNFWRVSLTLF